MKKQKTPKSRILALILAVALCALFPTTAFAEIIPDYTFNGSTGALTITSSTGFVGWKNLVGAVGNVTTVYIDSGAGPQIPDRAFAGCNNLSNVTFQGDVTIIGEYAFADCEHLTEIAIPDSVTTIGMDAFRGTGITSVAIPDGVTSISDETFQFCFNLSSVSFGDAVTSIGIRAFVRTALPTIALPESLTSIGEYAFLQCEELTSVTIPSNVTTIGKGAFYQCTNLDTITVEAATPPSLGDSAFALLPDDFKIYVPEGKVSDYKTAWSAYAGHIVGDEEPPTGDKGYTFANGTLTITADKGFANMQDDIRTGALNANDVRAVIVKGAVSEISVNAFYLNIGSFSSLTNVTIENGVTKIGITAFQNCHAMTSITIPNSVTSIDAGAFQYCRALTAITLPASVTSIGNGVFADSKGLSSITVLAKTPAAIGTDVFENTTADYKIYVPSGSVDAYRAAWADYKDHIVGGATPPPPSGSPSSSGGSKSSWTPSTNANVIDVPQGTLGLGTYNNYDTLLVAGLEKLVEQSKGKTVNFDRVENGKVLYRVKLDPAKLSGVLKSDLSLNAHIGQNDAAVLEVTNRFAKYYENNIVAITYDQAKPLGVSAEFAARLDLSKLNAKTLYFYSYDNTTNTYARIAAPNYFVDANGYSHITAPLGGSIIITDKLLSAK